MTARRPTAPPPAAGRRGGRPQGGFSLIELMVATLVTLVAMAIAAGLLVEARKLFAAAGREQRDPEVELAVAWLRADVGAASNHFGLPPWNNVSSGPLVLDLHQAGLVRYELDMKRGRLMRTAIGPDGTVRSRRAVLSRAVAWEWTELGSGLLAFELDYQRHAQPLVASAGRGRMQRDEPEVATDVFLVAMRGQVRYGWW